VDDFGRALSTVPEEKINDKSEAQKDLMNLYEGIKMTEQNLLKTLAKHGLVRFDPMGEKFNPNEHEAMFQAPMQGKEENSVIHTQQTGFRLNGRIIRAAKVGVVKNT
jgi:molecular chaperone GrpE